MERRGHFVEGYLLEHALEHALVLAGFKQWEAGSEDVSDVLDDEDDWKRFGWTWRDRPLGEYGFAVKLYPEYGGDFAVTWGMVDFQNEDIETEVSIFTSEWYTGLKTFVEAAARALSLHKAKTIKGP